MRFRRRFLATAMLFVVAPANVLWAQELSSDTNSPAGNARSPAKKGGAKLETMEEGINAAAPADLSSSIGPKEPDWTGSYAGVHGGALNSTGRSNP